MEAVLPLERPSDADSGYNFGKVIYLDPKDPLDDLVIKYGQDLDAEATPTAAEQRRLIAGIKSGDLASARELAGTHAGLVAALAYPFRQFNADPQDIDALLEAGSSALIRAALTYERTSGIDFDDHAAVTVHDKLAAMAPDFAAGSYIDREHPMESVYRFMQNTRPVRSEKTRRKLKEQAFMVSTDMTTMEAKIIKRSLYMKDEEIAGRSDIDKSKEGVGYIIRNFAKRNGLPSNNRIALILELHERGMSFDVVRPEKPLNELLYAHEIEIAKLLHMPSKDIVDALGLDCRVERVNEIVYEAREKVGARSAQELALMVRGYMIRATTLWR